MNNTDIFVVHPYLKSSRHDKDFFLDEAVNLVTSINLKCIFKSQVGLEKISSILS